MTDVRNLMADATTTAAAAQAPPNPGAFFQAVFAYQRSAALRAGIELDVFTAIAEGKRTPAEIAARSGSAERGVRILCDYLVVIGFLFKRPDGGYDLSEDAAPFLNRRSPAYLGGIVEFMMSPQLTSAFAGLTQAVRNGRTALSGDGTVEAENTNWVNFARAMAAMMAMPAELLAKLVNGESTQSIRVLDIAAGHGLFGIAFAKLNPSCHVVATDWAQVLAVAKENAKAAGVDRRFETIPGDAFEVDFGSKYDVVLIVNFLHHFDPPTCEKLLRKVRASLDDGGRAVVLEFIPNADRVSPPDSAAFALTMLATTPAGDAYTFEEYERMLRAAGFARCEFHPLPPSIQQVVIAHR